jgi:hypothetical protein
MFIASRLQLVAKSGFLTTVLPILLLTSAQVHGQDSSRSNTIGLNSSSLQQLGQRYKSLDGEVQKHSDRLLRRMQKMELAMERKVVQKDTAAAQLQFKGIQQQYDSMRARLFQPCTALNKMPMKHYIPHFDSLQTSLKYLQLERLQGSTIETSKFASVNSQLESLEGKLQQASELQGFVQARQQQLQAIMAKYNYTRQLNRVNQEVSGYQDLIRDYQKVLEDPDKLTEKIIANARNLPSFNSFFEKNSYLATLFPAPTGVGSTPALAGLQSSGQLQATIAQQMGISSNAGSGQLANPQQYMQQQVQQGQSQLNSLKDRLTKKLGNGNSEQTTPQGDTIQKRSLLKRVEYGFNIQSQFGSILLPAMVDLGLAAGYKINDKSTVGIGASYKLGCGKPVKDIHFSSQGLSLRTYLDIKLKGGLWVTGAIEDNYLSGFPHTADWRRSDQWSRNGLIGLTKKVSTAKKTANFQLLYDLLHVNGTSTGSALKFRVCYMWH